MLGDSMWILAQRAAPQPSQGVSVVLLLIQLSLVIGFFAGLWKVFEKAGKPGWTALIPIYNLIVFVELAGKPIWWTFLMFIPFVNFIIFIVLSLGLAKNFGKSEAYGIGIGLLGFIFLPLLGFSDAKYRRVAQ